MEKRSVLNSAVKSDSEEVWLTTELLGQKVGYSVLRFSRLSTGFRFDNFNQLKLGMMGKTQLVRARSRVITQPDFTLHAFEFELTSQDGSFQANGEVKKGDLIVNTREKRQVWKLTRSLYPIEALGKLIVQANPDPGAIFNYLTFDGAVMDTLPTEIEVLGREVVKMDGDTVTGLRVRVRRAKFDVITFLDKYGMTLKEVSSIGMNSRRVTEKEALAGEAGYPPDVLRLFAVPIDTIIPNPQKVKRVVLEITGIDTAEFKLTGSNQRIVSSSPLRLEISLPPLPEKLELPILTESEYLKPSVSIQSDAKEIRDKAKEIVGGTRDGTLAARKLLYWTHTSLKKEAIASFPNALDVLKNMKGDCNEHSVLYAALLRASGIPAKVVVGLVYQEPFFYYHAWNEVYLGNWIPVDATFGEFPSSVWHLKLAEGELGKQAEVLGVVRKIRIKVVEFE